MGHYPFTLFNGVTGLILVLDLALAWGRLRGATDATWPLFIYAGFGAYAAAFAGGLNFVWLGCGLICALAMRFGIRAREARWCEAIPLTYVAWRAVGLILMW